MKILQVSIEGLGNGGVQSVIMNICRSMPDIKFDILLFTNEKRNYDDEFLRLGGKIFRIPHYEGKRKLRKRLDYYIRFFRIFFKVYKILKREKYDVVHCHNHLESGICNLAARFAGVKIRIAHAHTDTNIYAKNKFLRNLYKKLLRSIMNKNTNVKIGVTEAAYHSLFGNKKLEKQNKFIIPNSIDLNKFSKKNNKRIKTISGYNIVNVARYEDNKNQMFIIDLLPIILNSVNNIKLKLIGFGDGPYKLKLVERINILQMENYVQFLPHDTDIPLILEETDIFILPSKSEGFGIVLLEAQAMEVPCLVSDTVPRDVDCGLCEFLSLDIEKEIWADEAINILTKKKVMKLNEEKIKKFDVDVFSKMIREIYEGKHI